MRAIRVLALVLITAGATVWVATCGGDGGTTPTPTTPPTPPTPPPPANRAPTATGSIEAQTIPAGESVTVDVAGNFTDPDGNTLSFSAASSDDAVATASVSGSSVTIEGVAAGSATVTVTASDPGGLSATQSISVTVEAVNQAPVGEGIIDDQGLVVGDEVTVDVSANFSDPDGDELTYTATSSDTTVATVATEGAMVTITAVGAGEATVTVTATDPGDLSATQEFGVTVEESNEPPVAEGTIDDVTVVAGSEVSVDVTANFSDPDGDDLTYAATSSDDAVATVATEGAVVTVTGVAPGSATVTVTASDAGMLLASLEFGVTVTPPPVPPEIVDTIPTHDVIVDSMVVLDVSPYFEEDGDLTYSATTSDGAVAEAVVDGSTLTTTGTGADSVGVSEAMLSVTATNEDGLSVTQDSIVVRVHQEEYGSLEGISVSEDGILMAEIVPGSPVPLSVCLQIKGFPVGGTPFTVFWSEWQRSVGSGWVVAQDNNKAHVTAVEGQGGSVCPINLDNVPPGTYRLVGHVQRGEETQYAKTNTFVKPEG